MSSAQGLVGRKAELVLAAAAVRELGEGRASVLVIEGEAGIGKTRLVQSIVGDARSRDVTVFCGEAHPFERTRPFGVVAAARSLSRRSADPRRAAIGALLAGEGAGLPVRGSGDVQYRVVEEIVDLVDASCAERPVLLVAEDIHWADSASLLAILSHAVVAFDIDDLDALKAMLSSVAPEIAAQAESHGVIMPMTVYVEA